MLPATGRALRMAAVGRKLAFSSVRPRLPQLRSSTTSRDHPAGMLPKFDYSSAAPMQSGVEKDALLAAAYEANSPASPEQSPPSLTGAARAEDGDTEYSPDAAMASFIAQQGGGGQSPPAAPATPQAAPAPRAEVRAAAAPGVGDAVSEGVASLRMVDALEADDLLSDAQVAPAPSMPHRTASLLWLLPRSFPRGCGSR